MKTLWTSYTFDPIAKTVALGGIPGQIALENVLVITNVTDNVILYNFADAAFAGTVEQGNVLTLAYNTTGMAATDRLQIYLDLPTDTTDDSSVFRNQYDLSLADARDDKPLVDFGLMANDGDPEGVMPIPVMVDTTGWPVVISGIGTDGNVRPMRTGRDGALQLTDASPVNFNLALASGVSGPSIDTTGYLSCAVQVVGTIGTGVITVYQSNDGSNWFACVGFSLASVAAPVSTIGAAGIFIFPCLGRYIRTQCTTGGTGPMAMSIMLRSAPMPALWNSAVASVGGNVTSVGATAAGSAPATNPVLMAGIDGTNVRRILTGTDGAVAIAGIDPGSSTRRVRTDESGTTLVRDFFGNDASAGVPEVLGNILNELKAIRLVLHDGMNVPDLNISDDPTLKN